MCMVHLQLGKADWGTNLDIVYRVDCVDKYTLSKLCVFCLKFLFGFCACLFWWFFSVCGFCGFCLIEMGVQLAVASMGNPQPNSIIIWIWALVMGIKMWIGMAIEKWEWERQREWEWEWIEEFGLGSEQWINYVPRINKIKHIRDIRWVDAKLKINDKR